MTALSAIARMFGVSLENADDVIRSERGYRAAINRRSLFAAAAAMAVGQVWVPGSLGVRRYSKVKIYVNFKYFGVTSVSQSADALVRLWLERPGLRAGRPSPNTDR